MSRMEIPCIDSEGRLVTFITSEHEGKELAQNYAIYQKWLNDNGFEQLSGKSGGRKPKVTIEGGKCPKCAGDMWDNREKIESGDFSPKSPHFSCKSKDCKAAYWEGQYEIKA